MTEASESLTFPHTNNCCNRDFKPTVEIDDVQGDVITQFPKVCEDFIFFKINRASGKRSETEDRAAGERFKKEIMPNLLLKVSSAADVIKARQRIAKHKESGSKDRLYLQFVNIAFTESGFKKLGLADKYDLKALEDPVFPTRQKDRAQDLGDRVNADGVPVDWRPDFKEELDGVLVVATESEGHTKQCHNEISKILGDYEVYTLHGRTRPGEKKHDEHFGWKDDISHPFLTGVHCPCQKKRGQREINPGVIVIGAEGDRARPSWAKNGSLMAFRELEQLVPEFHKYLEANPVSLTIPGCSPKELKKRGADLRGSQFVGRWPSGTPLQLSPCEDIKAMAECPNCINNYTFELDKQDKCPFSAHTRKVNPRLDGVLGAGDDTHSINRAGIAYGKELSKDEEEKGKSDAQTPRGLAFVCYQSNIARGFEFQQISWANETRFPHPFGGFKGVDPLIGQGDAWKSFVSQNPNIEAQLGNQLKEQPDLRVTTDNEGNVVKLENFVIPRGGEYFFVPPIKFLKDEVCTGEAKPQFKVVAVPISELKK